MSPARALLHAKHHPLGLPVPVAMTRLCPTSSALLTVDTLGVVLAFRLHHMVSASLWPAMSAAATRPWWRGGSARSKRYVGMLSGRSMIDRGKTVCRA
jgi:hypothetical protein